MGVNRFMSPVQTQYFQTYVNQFVPLPFELMQRRAEQEQQKFDTVKQQAGKLKAQINEDFLRVDQDPLLSGKQNEVYNAVNQGVQGYGGDYRQLDSLVANLGADYSKWISSGQGALAKGNKLTHDKNMKEIDDSKMAGYDKDIYKRYAKDRYDETGGAINNTQYQAVAPHTFVDAEERALKAVNALIADQGSSAFANYNDDGTLVINGHDDLKSLSKDRISKALIANIYNDQDFEGYTKQKYQIASYYANKAGKEVPSYKDFKNEEFKKRFGAYADAYAYEQLEKRRGANETYAAQAGAKREEEFGGPAFSISSRRAFGEDLDANDLSEGDGTEVLEKLDKQYTNTTDNYFKNIVKSDYVAQIPGGKPAYDKWLSKTAATYGVNPSDATGMRRVVQAIASGDVDMNALYGGNKVLANRAREEANKVNMNLRNKDQMKLSALEDMVNKGRISQEDWSKINKEFYALNDAEEALLAKRKAAMTTAEKGSIDQQLNEIARVRNGQAAFSTGVAKRIQNTTGIQVGDYKTTLDKVMDQKDNEEVYGNLIREANTYTKNARPNVVYKAELPISTNGKYDQAKSQQYAAKVSNDIKKQEQALLGSIGRDPVSGKEMTLGEIFQSKAKQAQDAGDERSLTEIYTSLKNDYFKNNNIMFGDTFHPKSGSALVRFGDIELDLHTGPGGVNIDMSSMPAETRKKMNINTELTEAALSPSRNTEIAPNVFIYTKKPKEGQEIDGNFETTLEDGTSYGVRISTGGGNFLYLPKQDAEVYLDRKESMEQSARNNNGYVDIPMNGVIKRVPLQQALELLKESITKKG